MNQPIYTFDEWCAALDSVARRWGWGGLTFEPYQAGTIVGYRVASGALPICTLQLTPCKTGAIFGTYPPSMKERQSCSWFDLEAEALAGRKENQIVRAVYQEMSRLWDEKVGKEVHDGPKAGTLDRVKEAHRLITQQNLTRTKAFKRAKTDSRTYDRWCKAATGEEPILPYSDS
jgi:hypothetical protein